MFFCVKFKKIIIFVFLGLIGVLIFTAIIRLSVSAYTKSRGIHVPIIMYHSILNNSAQLGDYVLSPVTLEEDMIYLKDNGYTTIFVGDLINYVYKDGTLPEKPVILTFDDGFYNNYTYVLPLLEKYDMKADISVVGSYSQKFSDIDEKKPAYAYLDWKTICNMVKTKRIEIGNHSYNMHTNDSKRKGCTINKGETPESYRNVFMGDTVALQNKLKDNCGFEPQFYTYPFGFYSNETVENLKALGFKASLTVAEKPNYITKDKNCLFNLNRYNRPSGISTYQFMTKALKF